MKKIYYFSFVAFALGLCCFILFAIIGSQVAANGTLIEPFGLIPIGFLLITIGSILTFAASIWYLFNNPNKFDRWVFGISLSFIVLAGLYLAASFSYLSESAKEEISQNATSSIITQTPISIPNNKDIKNITYFIDNEAVALVNGQAEKLIADDSVSKQITQYFGNEVMADFNNDGFEDTAFLLAQDSSGSGTFFYVVAALGSRDGYSGTNAILLGDRVSPQSTEYQNGKIIVNYQNRAVTDSFAVEPSIGVSRYFEIDGNKLVEVLN